MFTIVQRPALSCLFSFKLGQNERCAIMELILKSSIKKNPERMKTLSILVIVFFCLFFFWIPNAIGASVFGLLAGLFGAIVGLIGGVIGLITGIIAGFFKLLVHKITFPFMTIYHKITLYNMISNHLWKY